MTLLAPLLALLLVSPAPRHQDDDPPDPVPATGTVHVTVVDENGDGVFKAHVVVKPSEEESAAVSGQTDPDGLAILGVPAGSALSIDVFKFNETSRETVDVKALAAGEEREIVVAVKTRADRELTGRVVADEDGRPLADVAVHVERSTSFSSRATPFVLRGSPAARTDEDGVFRVPYASWASEVATFSVAGRGPRRAVLKDAGGTEGLVVHLQRGARLSGRITGEIPAGARVEAEASGYELFEASASALTLSGDVTFSAPVERNGSFAFEDLPSGVRLKLRLVAGRETLLQEPRPRALQPGGSAEVEWALNSGGRIVGRVTDASGEPMADHVVWLLTQDEARPGLLESYVTPLRRSRSDDAGRFSFEGVRTGVWTVGLAPADRGTDMTEAHAPVAVAVTVEPAAGDAEVALTVHRGLVLTGRVVDPEGNPIQAFVSVAGGAYLSERSESDGKFRIGPLLPGEYRVHAGTFGTGGLLLADSEAAPVTVGGATEELVLRLRLGGSLAGIALDDGTGDPVPANIVLTAAEGRTAWSRSGEESEFEFGGLLPGHYHLTATTQDGRIGILNDFEVEAGVARRRLEVFLVPGGFVRVGYDGPGEVGNYEIEVDGARIATDGLYSGTRARCVVPPGKVTVAFRVIDRTSAVRPFPVLFEERRTVEVDAGEEVEVFFAHEGE